MRKSECDVKGIFIAIGHDPNSRYIPWSTRYGKRLYLNNSGVNGGATATSIPGVFAAGDVTDYIYRQAITSAGTGCMAALDAEKYLESVKN